jgi:hypothetical protein
MHKEIEKRVKENINIQILDFMQDIEDESLFYAKSTFGELVKIIEFHFKPHSIALHKSYNVFNYDVKIFNGDFVKSIYFTRGGRSLTIKIVRMELYTRISIADLIVREGQEDKFVYEKCEIYHAT